MAVKHWVVALGLLLAGCADLPSASSGGFTYEFDPAYVSREDDNQLGGFVLKGSQKLYIYMPNKVSATFEPSATDDDVQRFLGRYKAKILQYISGDEGKRLIVRLDPDTIELKDLPTLAAEAGLKGAYLFSDRKMAKVYQEVTRLNKTHDYHLRGVAILDTGAQFK